MEKIKKCPECKMKPVAMPAEKFSGYIFCPLCMKKTGMYYRRTTRVHDSDLDPLGKGWKTKAKKEWNERVEQEQQLRKNWAKHCGNDEIYIRIVMEGKMHSPSLDITIGASGIWGI